MVAKAGEVASILVLSEDSSKEATCLGSAHKHELAERGFPADAVYEAGASFSESVHRALDCSALCADLGASKPNVHP